MFDINEMHKLRLGATPPAWAVERNSLQTKLDAQGGWYENFYFENGAATKGRSPSPKKLMSLSLPASLEGVSILDVGAYEGFYSIQMEQRGALVTANDHFVWNWPGDNSKSNLELVMEITNSRISILEADLDSLPIHKHDITLFLGVLYHLEDQIGALRQVRETATNLVVLETLVDDLHASGASLKYYPDKSLNNDSSNQFGPNLDALTGLIKAAGFRDYEFKGIWELNPVAKHATMEAPLSPLTSGRVVFWLYP